VIYAEKEFTLKDGTTVIFRTPEPCEGAELLEFKRRLVSETDFLLTSPEDLTGSAEDEAAMLERVRAGKDCFIGAYAGGRLIGDCCLSFNWHLKDRHRASIGIGIYEEYCGRGLGTLFFCELLDAAKASGSIEQVELGAIEGNDRAIGLYHKMGFEDVARLPRALKLKDGSCRDEILMVKYL